jgi:hypothetical protein
MKKCKQKDCNNIIKELKFSYCNLHRKTKKVNKYEEQERNIIEQERNIIEQERNIIEQERNILMKEQNEQYQKCLEEDLKIARKNELKTENDILKTSYEQNLVEPNKDLVVTIKFKIPAPINKILTRTFYKNDLLSEIFRYLDIMLYDEITNYTLFLYPKEEILKEYELNLINDFIQNSCVCFIVNNEL